MVRTRTGGSRRALVGSVALLLAAALAFVAIDAAGARLQPGPPAGAPPTGGEGAQAVLGNVLLALAVITLLARLLGGVFRRWLHQPPVLGEILAGLLLGPSFLGALWPEALSALLPAPAVPALGIVAKVGVVLFMFLVGLELDLSRLRGSRRALLAISHASIVVPFVCGAALALLLYPRYAAAGVDFTVFALFVGISLSVTAFPVLARILTDRGAARTRLGTTALTCAAFGDATAWVLLALVAGVATQSLAGALWSVPLVLGYAAAMLLVVRPALAPFVRRQQQGRGPLSSSALALVFAALLLSAAVTEALGIHALFGAFLVGVVLPAEGRLPHELRARLEDVLRVLFLPAFFAFTGMHTQVGLLAGPGDALVCALVVAVATLGKWGGTALAARATGMAWRPASALGVLMNTRGLMELVVLDVGLGLGVITPTVFTMFVLMALVTTFMTAPLLDLVLGRRGFAEEPEGVPSPSPPR